jgi:hypothetical protein
MKRIKNAFEVGLKRSIRYINLEADNVMFREFKSDVKSVKATFIYNPSFLSAFHHFKIGQKYHNQLH